VTPFEAFFDGIERTDLSVWVRGESMLAFPTILSLHTIGMGFLAGISVAIALRILGFARGVPLTALEKFYPVLWAALALNFTSGIFLLIGYPYKAATNPVFYVKMALIALAVYLLVRVRKDVLRIPEGASKHARLLATLSLGSWAGAIFAGRLLAYTFHWLRVGIPGGF
jgi:hypothetical protein